MSLMLVLKVIAIFEQNVTNNAKKRIKIGSTHNEKL